MNIGQGTHKMAPPAGVEPTTYRLGGGRYHTDRDVDLEGVSSFERQIFLDAIPSYCSTIFDRFQSLLDEVGL